MSSLHPATVRKAVAEFTPRRPQKFQDLLPEKHVIVELRQKRGSYRAIAQLLTQALSADQQNRGRPVLSRTARRNRSTAQTDRAKTITCSRLATGDGPLPAAPPSADVRPQTEKSANPDSGEASPSRVRGPRIAQVRMLNSQDK